MTVLLTSLISAAMIYAVIQVTAAKVGRSTVQETCVYFNKTIGVITLEIIINILLIVHTIFVDTLTDRVISGIADLCCIVTTPLLTGRLVGVFINITLIQTIAEFVAGLVRRSVTSFVESRIVSKQACLKISCYGTCVVTVTVINHNAVIISSFRSAVVFTSQLTVAVFTA